MFGSEILDIVIGLVFIFLLLSLLCSAVKEAFEAWMKKRASDLEKGIRMLLHDPDGTALANRLYNHPLVYGLFQGEYEPGKIKENGNYQRASNLPSYIPTRTFALALMDIIAPNVSTPSASPADASNTAGVAPSGIANTGNAAVSSPAASAPASTSNPLQPFRAAINQIENEKVRQALTALANAAGNDMNKFRENIEAWYDAAMERVSGWYKRHSQKMLLLFAFIITIGMNVNTIDIANHLFRDKALRDALVAQAEVIAKDPNAPKNGIPNIEGEIQKIGLPIGWAQVKCDCSKFTANYIVWNCVLLPFFGWSITAFAISLGAPFWFDLLNKFIKIRSTIKPSKGGADKPASG